MSTTEKPHSLFSPGRIVYPPKVQRALRRAGLHGVALLARHLTGDWGQIDPKRDQVNRWAMAQVKEHNKPVISRFPLSAEEWVLIITRHLHTPGRRETTFTLRCAADAQPRPHRKDEGGRRKAEGRKRKSSSLIPHPSSFTRSVPKPRRVK